MGLSGRTGCIVLGFWVQATLAAFAGVQAQVEVLGESLPTYIDCAGSSAVCHSVSRAPIAIYACLVLARWMQLAWSVQGRLE